jgi:L-seryl-tRNA(Ser) seleniumtransferase
MKGAGFKPALHPLMLNSPVACANLNYLMAEPVTNLLREIPSVDRLLKHANCEVLLTRYNRDYVTQKCREVLERLRAEIRQDTSFSPGDIEDEAVIKRLEATIRAETVPGHVRVVNATGTILHTNLGAPCCPKRRSMP